MLRVQCNQTESKGLPCKGLPCRMHAGVRGPVLQTAPHSAANCFAHAVHVHGTAQRTGQAVLAWQMCMD